MHHHLEVIMPPTKDIGIALETIMNPFSEHVKDNEGYEAFWDFYTMGGRWAGHKELFTYPDDKLDLFYEKIREAKITVSGLQCGKQEISPASQIPKVDKIWNEIFPTENGEIIACPIFKHSNNQYDSDDLISCDITRLEDVPPGYKAARVIIAGPNHYDTNIEAKFMLADSAWNGVNFMPIDWDGKIETAVEKYKEDLKSYREDYKAKQIPQKNWLCITIDYHS